MHERAARVSRARVDDEPGRLVDDEQVLVLVGDRSSSGSGASRAGLARAARRSTSSPPSSRWLFARGVAVDEDAPAAISALGRGARADLERPARKRSSRCGRSGANSDEWTTAPGGRRVAAVGARRARRAGSRRRRR